MTAPRSPAPVRMPAELEVLDLLVGKWNPPHRPPRAIALPGQPALTLPRGYAAGHLSGASLRGLDLSLIEVEALSGCDLRGACWPEAERPPIADERADLRARLAAWPVGRPWPELAPPAEAAWPGHGGQVQALCLAPDGQWAASAADDGLVLLWALRPDGGLRRGTALTGHIGRVWDLALSRSGRWLASAGADLMVRLWAVNGPDDARETATMTGHESSVLRVAFTPDERRLASVDSAGGLRLWDIGLSGIVRDGGSVRLPTQATPLALGFIDEGRRALVLDADGRSWVWDLRSAPPDDAGFTAPPGERGGALTCMAKRQDSRMTAAGDHHGALHFWDREPGPSGTPQADTVNEAHRSAVRCLSWSPCGRWLATGGDDRMVRVWIVGPAHPVQLVCEADGHEGPPCALAFSPDGRHLLSSDVLGSVMHWGVQPNGTTRLAGKIRGQCGDVEVYAASADGGLVAGFGGYSGFQLWRGQPDGTVRSIPAPVGTPPFPRCLSVAGDGSLLAVGHGRQVEVWRVDADGMLRAAGRCLAVGAVQHLAVSFEGSTLASAGEHGIDLWHATPEGVWALATTVSLAGGMQPTTLRGLVRASGGFSWVGVDGMGVLAHGRIEPITASPGWTSVPGVQLELVVRSGWTLTLSPNGDAVAMADDKGGFRLYDTRPGSSGGLMAPVDGRAAGRRLSFSPDGRWLAAADLQGEIEVWALNDLSPSGPPTRLRHPSGRACVAHLSNDGRQLVSGGDDGRLCVWTRDAADDAPWRCVQMHLGGGIAFRAPDDAAQWHLERSDGLPWATAPTADGDTLADPDGYPWLRFGHPDFGEVPAFEVPAPWLQFSADRRVLSVERRPRRLGPASIDVADGPTTPRPA